MSDNDQSSRSELAAWFCAIPVAVALAASFGWWLDVPVLRNPFPHQPPVAPSTALCLLALCVAILVGASPKRAYRFAAVGAGVFTLGIASLIAFHYLVPSIVDLEQLVWPLNLPLASGFAPGRMAPNTAILVILLSVATLLPCGSRKSSWIWHACVLATLISSLSFVIGFLYQVSAIYGVGTFTPIALPTAVSLLCLSCAHVSSSPNIGLMKLLRGPGEGSYSIRRLLPAAIGIPILLGYLRGVGESAGLFDPTLGATLLVLLMIVSFGALIIRNGILLNALSEERNKSLDTIKCLYGDLTEARDRAVQAARVKSEFLANMSHEIRTPMNAVIGCADMLQRTNLNSDQTRFVDIIMSSGSALVDIIDDILVLSKIEAGKLEMEKVPTNIVDLIESCAELVAEKAQSKKLSLTTFVAPELDRQVLCDPQRIRQVLLNILSNAIKFTDTGSVTIQAQGESATDETVMISMSVVDTGIGIDGQHVHKLFQPFSQCDSSGTRRYSGTGLGLAICRRLVELMGGSIGVSSTEGHGSTFTVSLPFQYAQDSTCRSRHIDVAGVNLLVVGVPINEFSVIKGYCEAWDVQADYAPDTPSALFYADMAASVSKPYTIVLCEPLIGQGGTDALTLRNLLTGHHAHQMRFVLLSPLDHSGNNEEFRLHGFDAVVNKPIRQSDLFDTIVNVSALSTGIGKAKQRADNEAVLAKSRIDTFSSELPNDACKRILLVEDNAINQEVAAMQLRELGFEPEVCSGGKQALDYLQHHRVALILMDCQMPDMDGFAATAAIRAIEDEKRIRTPIVAMTANAMEGDREHCLQAGMDDYIGKPVTADKLKEVIEKWFLVALDATPAESAAELATDNTGESGATSVDAIGAPGTGESLTRSTGESGAHKTAEIEAPTNARAGAVNNAKAAVAGSAPALFESNDKGSIISIEELEGPMIQLTNMFGEAAAERFLSMFLSQTPPLIEKIQDAIRSNDCQALRAVAHELKGSCFAVNCNRLAELSYQVERCARAEDIGGAAIALSPLERAFCRAAKHMEAWIHSRSAGSMPNQKTEIIRVLLVEDNELTRRGIATILERLHGLVVCGEAEDGLSAVQAIATARPDVAVVDIGLPGMNGIEVTRRVKAITPKTKVLILTSNDDEEDMFGAFAAGADGYITKHAFDSHRLELAVRTVNSGACWLDPNIARRILSVATTAAAGRGFPGAEDVQRAAPLSESEQTLLQAVAADSADCCNGVCQVEPAFLERLQRFASSSIAVGRRY